MIQAFYSSLFDYYTFKLAFLLFEKEIDNLG